MVGHPMVAVEGCQPGISWFNDGQSDEPNDRYRTDNADGHGLWHDGMLFITEVRAFGRRYTSEQCRRESSPLG